MSGYFYYREIVIHQAGALPGRSKCRQAIGATGANRPRGSEWCEPAGAQGEEKGQAWVSAVWLLRAAALDRISVRVTPSVSRIGRYTPSMNTLSSKMPSA